MHLLYKVTLLLIFAHDALQDVIFNILHTGDIHGNYEQAAKIARYVEKEKRNPRPPTIYMDAGDIFTGTVQFVVGTHIIATKVMKELKPDCLALGNHEFDKGIEGLKYYAANVCRKILCCNCDITKEPDLQAHFLNSTTIKINKHDVGIIGYINKNYRTEAFGQVYFNDEITSINEQIQIMKKKKVNIIILLGHGGYALDKRIAAQSEDIDVIVGGHSHTLLQGPDRSGGRGPQPSGPYPTLIKNKNGRNVPIVHAYCNGELIGKLKVTFSNNGILKHYDGSLVQTKGEETSDRIMDILKTIKPQIDKLKAQGVGHSSINVNNGGCRQVECNLGNIAMDSLIDYNLQKYHSTKGRKSWSDIGVAFINGGALRNGITHDPGGRISMADVLACFPFGNRIVSLEMKGNIIRQALEHSIAQEMGSDGEFLQVSGIHVIYNFTKPKRERVVNVRLRCADCPNPEYEQLSDSKVYRVLTIEFLASGGDGYKELLTNATRLDTSLEIDFQIFAGYITRKKLIQPMLEENIIVFGDTRKSDGSDCSCKGNVHLILCLVIGFIINR